MKKNRKEQGKEILEFISNLQTQELQASEEALSEYRAIQHCLRQKELVLAEQERRRGANIAMFSPLETSDLSEGSADWREESERLKQELLKLEQRSRELEERCAFLGKTKSFLSDCLSEPEPVPGKSPEETYGEYSLKLLETQELDRNRIARDLHDSTVQNLTGLVHKTELCSKLLDIDLVRAKVELHSMIETIKETINDMREVIYDLRPASLSHLSLSAALDSYASHLRRTHGLEVSFKTEGKEPEVLPIVRVTLYRIVQEACGNIVKHAQAKHVRISILYLQKEIEVEIEDDGIGFEHTDRMNGNEKGEMHFGLSTMKERANLLKGSFCLETEQGAGTKIRVKVPVLEG